MADQSNLLVRYAGPACLAGITAGDWIRLLADNGGRVSPCYWGKAAFLTASSVVTSGMRLLEEALYRRRLADVTVRSPLFIIGSWRSGTTHLHNLLSLDDQFVTPNLYQTMYPHTFLVSEHWLRPLLDLMTPRKRFMDNMEMGLREPAEDEMALAILTQRSNMLSWTFPARAAHYDNFLDFEGTTDADRRIWKQQLDRFIRKFALRGGGRPLLKSPNHTARIQLILEQYPDARFLHIHRHPYEVYRSLVHMARSVIPVWGLQVFPEDTLTDMVIALYRRLYAAYFAQVSSIPSGQVHEIGYDELVRSPIEILEGSYGALNLDGFDALRPRLQQYVDSKASYQRNRHAEIPAPIRERLHREWRQSFETWNYAIEPSADVVSRPNEAVPAAD